MRFTVGAFVLMLSIAAVTGTAVAAGGTTVEHVAGTARAFTPPSDLRLDYMWSLPLTDGALYDLPHPAARKRSPMIWVRRDLIIMVTNTGKLFVIRRSDGFAQWSMQLTHKPSFPPVVNEKFVYNFIGNEIQCIDRISGEVVWKNEPRFPASSAPCITIGRSAEEPAIYAPSWEKKFYAIEIHKKRRVYYEGETEEESLVGWEYPIYKYWQIGTKGHVMAEPQLYQGLIYFATDEGTVYSVSRDGEVRWSFPTGGAIYAPVATSEQLLCAGSADYNVYGLDRLTGERLWHFATGSGVFEPTYIDEKIGVVFAISSDQGFFAIDANSGKELWNLPDGIDIVGVGPNLVYVSMMEGRLAAIEKKSGVIKWISLLDGIITPVRNFNDYTSSADAMRAYFIAGSPERPILVAFKWKAERTGPLSEDKNP